MVAGQNALLPEDFDSGSPELAMGGVELLDDAEILSLFLPGGELLGEYIESHFIISAPSKLLLELYITRSLLYSTIEELVMKTKQQKITLTDNVSCSTPSKIL